MSLLGTCSTLAPVAGAAGLGVGEEMFCLYFLHSLLSHLVVISLLVCHQINQVALCIEGKEHKLIVLPYICLSVCKSCRMILLLLKGHGTRISLKNQLVHAETGVCIAMHKFSN